MAIGERKQLSSDVQGELDLLIYHATQFAKDMTTIPGREISSNELRNRLLATFIIEVADFADSVDHLTSTELGGTRNIQDFCQETRESARRYNANIPESY